MRAKRRIRQEHRAWVEHHLMGETDPRLCNCTHAGLPPTYHHQGCLVRVESEQDKPR